MKVWEKLGATKESVRDGMYLNRELPCTVDDEIKIIGKYRMDKLCVRMDCDCEKCLDAFLDLTVYDKKPYKKVNKHYKNQLSLDEAKLRGMA